MANAIETLREEFDAAFARPSQKSSQGLQAFLTIRVGPRPYALPLSELGWIAPAQRLTALPSSDPALLGLCFIHGATVPVFDLAVVLGEARQLDVRWIVLSMGPNPVGLAFTALEGHLRVAPQQLMTLSSPGQKPTSLVIRTAPEQRPIIQMDAVVEQVLGGAKDNVERTNA
jgi:chemotaxis signal transduction protein